VPGRTGILLCDAGDAIGTGSPLALYRNQNQSLRLTISALEDPVLTIRSLDRAVMIAAGILALCSLLPGIVPHAEGAGRTQVTWSASVIRVRDGDSLLVRARGRDIEVRLADVDAPERGQPHADQARKALIDLLQRRDVTVEVLDTDPYHRKVARVHRVPDGLDINAEVVRTGNAWVYRRYVRDQSLFALEQAARDRHAGLWALPEDQRIPPWAYRERERRRAN
jgi:endonuclease YncB( thermonuclease family)